MRSNGRHAGRPQGYARSPFHNPNKNIEIKQEESKYEESELTQETRELLTATCITEETLQKLHDSYLSRSPVSVL